MWGWGVVISIVLQCGRWGYINARNTSELHRHATISDTHSCICQLMLERTNGVLGHDSALLRLCWTEDNLGE